LGSVARCHSVGIPALVANTEGSHGGVHDEV
jgi:hypothetical protein